MKKILLAKFTLGIIFALSQSALCSASVTLPWSTTFNCPEWTWNGSQMSCDGMEMSGGRELYDASCNPGHEQITTSANYPSGGGGRGQAHYLCGSCNSSASSTSEGILVTFSQNQSEIWVRWYAKFQSGFSWYNNWPAQKILYIFSESGTLAPVKFEYTDSFGLSMPYSEYFGAGTGWATTMGGAKGDGQWHYYEVHCKRDTNGSNGVFEYWIDDRPIQSFKNVNYGGHYFHQIGFGSNAANVCGGPFYMYLDDIAISNTGRIGPIGSTPTATPVPTSPTATPVPSNPDPSTVLFEETFESTNLAAKGWYDDTTPEFSTTETMPGSTRSLQNRFLINGTQPVNGGAMRMRFQATETLYISYNIKYSSNWQGSGTPYPHHEVHALTNKDDDWVGMAFTRLTTYIENSNGRPRLALQDGRNIDQSRIGSNLVNVTENRSVMGCNGDSDGYGNGDCYNAGAGTYWNGKQWVGNSAVITNGQWHKVEVFYKINSLSGGKGIPDGVMQYWIDGQLIINVNNIMYRTAQNSDMKFDKFIIAPFIGDGSPIAQTFWMDNLILASSKPGDTGGAISSPTGLQIVNSAP